MATKKTNVINNETNSLFVETNIGINETSPQELLHLTANNAGIRLEDDGGAYANIFQSATQLQISADPNDLVASTDIVFLIDGSEVVRIDDNGYVGINDPTPDTALAIVGDDQTSSTITVKRYSDNASPAYLDIMKARGASEAPTAINNGDDMGKIWFRGYMGTGFAARGEYLVEATENWDGSNQGTRHAFKATANGTTSMVEVFSIDGSGYVTFNQAYTLPNTDGTINQVLKTDGSETVSWGEVDISELSITHLTPATQTVTTGTLSSGTVTDVQTWGDGNTVNISEVTGTPGFDVRYTFTGVADFSHIGLSSYYVGSAIHWSEVQIYDDANATWRTLLTIPSSLGFDYRYTDFPDPTNIADYINGSDQVIIRFYHPTNGNASHDLYVDYVSITGKST